MEEKNNELTPVTTGEDTMPKEELTLAQKVEQVEVELVNAMLKAADPILKKNGFNGFKNVQLIQSPPDENGNFTQSLRINV